MSSPWRSRFRTRCCRITPSARRAMSAPPNTASHSASRSRCFATPPIRRPFSTARTKIRRFWSSAVGSRCAAMMERSQRDPTAELQNLRILVRAVEKGLRIGGVAKQRERDAEWDAVLGGADIARRALGVMRQHLVRNRDLHGDDILRAKAMVALEPQNGAHRRLCADMAGEHLEPDVQALQ